MPFSSSTYSTVHPNGLSSTTTTTSLSCSQGFTHLFHDTVALSIATEASSHSSGLTSLYYQPYVYAGGGLGNFDECRYIVMTKSTSATLPGDGLISCLAENEGGPSVASVCVPKECTAHDMTSDDFIQTIMRITMSDEGLDYNTNWNFNNSGDQQLQATTTTPMDPKIVMEYVQLHTNIQEVTRFLKTKWTCGSYIVPWRWGQSGVYLVLLCGFMVMTIVGTNKYQQQKKQSHQHHHQCLLTNNVETEEEKKDNGSPVRRVPMRHSSLSGWTHHWNLTSNIAKLFHRRPATACLDGLRVISILWIIMGHVMAIQSSSGGGYSNPADFLPPFGITTSLGGQLFFASRFAVDTFLVISGYLVVHVLLQLPSRGVGHFYFGFLWRYLSTLPKLVMGRLLRILPLYMMLLGFWIYVAPHLGGGPFWHQWQPLLQPCRDYGWTNLLFVNNFYPLNLANTQTCFYHSWYLAVDLQLFLLAPIIVYLYQQHPRAGKFATLTLMLTSMAVTFYLTYTRKWSINSFDGAAVARFDVEGYAKPHIRAQAYLAGMGVAFYLNQPLVIPMSRYHMMMALGILTVVSFCTVTGAYSRRPCRYEEWPVECGSTWSETASMVYTGSSRALWTISVSVVMVVCLQGHGGWVGHLLSLPMWTPLSHLTFCVYLVHPIVIFVWQLGARQKEAFRLLDFGMKYIAVTTVSFGLALFFCMIVEFPMANVIKQCLSRRIQSKTTGYERIVVDVEMEPAAKRYGSMSGNHRDPA